MRNADVGRRSPLTFALALACSILPSLSARSAFAAGPGPSLVRMLHRPGRAHVLADARGRIPFTTKIPTGYDARDLGLSPVAPGIGALRLAPEEVDAFAAAHPYLTLSVAPPRKALLDVSPTWTHVTEFRAATNGLSGRGVVVGVVDTGLDVRHPDVRTADGHTRVAWMLTGGAPRGLHPDVEEAFGCADTSTPCAVYAAADIDAILAGTLADQGDLGDVDGHGTHVTSIAAGNGGPSVSPQPKYVGLAPDATLVIAAPSADGSFPDADILNGARFVFDRADALGMPVVLNVSLGSDYGAHDGTSDLESGLSAFIGDDHPGRAIAVAAGNSGQLFLTSTGAFGIHTEAHVSDGEAVRIPFIPGGAVADGAIFVWLTFRPGDHISVALEGPCGASWVGATGGGDVSTFSESGFQGGIVNDVPSQEPAAVTPTNSAIVSLEGAWDVSTSCGGASTPTEFALTLRGSGDASLWISPQKDAELAGVYFEKALRQGTITIPASGPLLLSAGCTVNRLAWTPLMGPAIDVMMLGDDASPVVDSACYFSSSGPTPFGVEKPEIASPGGFVAAAMSSGADPRVNMDPNGLFYSTQCSVGNDCLVVDDTHAIASGTSMSAPHVTGAIALLMGLDPTLTEARATAVLQAGARRTTGHVSDPTQVGPGSLDVEGARVALLDAMTAPIEAAPSESWFSLSSLYARPDPSWPVWGTIELRTSDGAVAGSIDGSKLALAITTTDRTTHPAGVVVQPITRVRPGLYRFAFTGGPDDLGARFRVDVTYDGVSLGAQFLPVGWDAWSAVDPAVGAVGACAMSDRPGASHGAGLAMIAGLLAMIAARATSRSSSRSGSRSRCRHSRSSRCRR